jgi:hypothetical protein
VQPEGQLGGTAVGGLVGLGVGPFAQGGLDESLGLSVIRYVTPGAFSSG